jgi:hypothetical protein
VRDGPSYRLVVTCQLRSGSYWDSDDIVVKANRAGSRVRIVFGGSGIAGPSDQLVLPFTVDPYRLVARLEPDTTLVIEAPIINR